MRQHLGNRVTTHLKYRKNALGNLGNALYGLGEKKQGIDLVKQALSIFEAIESPNAEWALNKLKEWGEV